MLARGEECTMASVAGSWAELDPRWPWLDGCFHFWGSSSAQLSSVSSWLWGLLMAYPMRMIDDFLSTASSLSSRWNVWQLLTQHYVFLVLESSNIVLTMYETLIALLESLKLCLPKPTHAISAQFQRVSSAISMHESLAISESWFLGQEKQVFTCGRSRSMCYPFKPHQYDPATCQCLLIK